MTDTAKSTEVVDRGLLTVPGLKRGLAVERSRRRPIEDMHRRFDGLSPEVAGQMFGLEYGPRHGHDALISAFHHPILLRRIGGGELSLHAVLGAVAPEVDGGELPPTIGM